MADSTGPTPGQRSSLVTRRTIWGAAVGTVCLLGMLIVSLLLVPRLLYPPLTGADLAGVADPVTRIQLAQAQDQLQNNVRSALLQVTVGLLVVVGAVATWRQVHVNREGQITERLTRAVEQIGSENVDVRIGGIYALERIGRNSPSDRRTVQFILAAFVRNHAPWHAGTSDGPEHPTASLAERFSLRMVAPDIQVVVSVLARRSPYFDSRDTTPYRGRLYLSRVDLRGLEILRGELVKTHFQYSNLARANLQGTRLDRSVLTAADLRECQLEEAGFVDADLSRAYLSGANLRGADLRGAILFGADLRNTDLTDTVLEGAKADTATVWPSGFDSDRIRRAGVKLIDPPVVATDP
jgi:hypothetical protein